MTHDQRAPIVLNEMELRQRIRQVLKRGSLLDKSRRRISKRVSITRLSRIVCAHHDTIWADRCAQIKILETQVSFIARLTTTGARDRDEARRIVHKLFDRQTTPEDPHSQDVRTVARELRSYLWPEMKKTMRIKLTSAVGTDAQTLTDLLDSFASLEELTQGLNGLINEVMRLSGHYIGDELVVHVLRWRHRLNRELANYFKSYDQWLERRRQLAKRLYQEPALDPVRGKVSEQKLMDLVLWLYPRVYDLHPLKDLRRGTWVLISGTPASGKSTIAADVAQRLGIRTVYPGDAGARELVRNALLWFLERDFDQFTIQHSLLRALYQSSFDGDLVDFYEQSLLTMRLGLEPALMVHNGRSVVFENVSILPGALPKWVYELGDVHVITLDVKPEVHQNVLLREISPAPHGAGLLATYRPIR